MTVTREDLQRWVEAGLIDDAVARRILVFEGQSARDRGARSDRPGIVELFIYLAAAITSAGIAVLIATNWEHLPAAARIAIPAIAAGAVFLAGEWLRRTGDEPMLRGASLLWLLAGVLAVATVAVAASEAGASEDSIALAAGITALAVGVALWAPMRMHPQIVGIGGAEFLFATAVSGRAGEDWSIAILGFLLAAFGVIGVAATESGILGPRLSARLLAGAGLAAGAFWAGLPPSPAVTELLALVVVTVLLVAGVRFRSLVYVAFGVLTAFAGMLKLILRHVEDPTLAGLALVAIGVLLLIAIAALRKFQPWAHEGASPFGSL